MITVLIGISGSGKSSWARECIKDLNTIRVNRDDLRRTLFTLDVDYYSHPQFKKRENIVSEVLEQTIYDNLNRGMDIIIDNTNLKLAYIREIIRKFNHLSDIQLRLMEVDKHVARERVQKRDGLDESQTSYIERQYNDFQNLKKRLQDLDMFYPQTNPTIDFNPNLLKVYLIDLDGTLCRIKDRNIFDETLVHTDTQIEEVGHVVRGLVRQGFTPIFISGRTDGCYQDSKEWLINNNLWCAESELYMRKKGDTRPDYIIKEEIVVNEIAPRYNVIGAIDDRIGVTREYFRLGIFVLNVNQGLIKF